MRPFLRLLSAAMLLPMMLSEGASAQSLGGSLTLGGSGNGSGSFEGGPLLVASTGTSATPWTVPAGGTLAVVAVQPLQLWGSLIVDASGGQITVNGTLVVNQGGTLQLGGPSGVGLITIQQPQFLPGSTCRIVVGAVDVRPTYVADLQLGGRLEVLEGATFAFRAGDRIPLFEMMSPGGTFSGDFSEVILPAGVSGTVVREERRILLVIDHAVGASLLNVSSRARIEGGENALIGGFVLQGSVPKRILLTAFGPSLTNFGVSGALSRTKVEVRSADGALVGTNDGWRNGNSAAQLQELGVAPSHPGESALILELPPGAYTAIVRGPAGENGVGLLEAVDLTKSLRASARPINLSSRARVQAGDQVLIGGFVLDGQRERRVLIRGLGPSLAAYGILGTLAAPRLTLRDALGAVVAVNEGWYTGQRAELEASGFAPAHERDSAIIATLPSGAYTVVLDASDARQSGVALIEIYDLE